MTKSVEAESSQSEGMMGILDRKKAPNKQRLCVDEIINEDDSVVSLPPETMHSLNLSHGHSVWIKAKKGRQSISIAIAYDDTRECDIEPKIRLNRVVMNELLVKIGGFVSVHRPPDVKKREHILSKDDNLKLSEFLNNIPDSILSAIFLRLPNGRSVVQYSSVCKRWYSIISSLAFIRGFIHIHDHRCLQSSNDYYFSRPFTLLFARYDANFYDEDPHYFELFCQVFSEKSKVPQGRLLSTYLNFLPYPVAILASCDDLVLATSLKHTYLGHAPYTGATKNYVCNPLTKQWLELPKVIPYCIHGYGFVREPTSCNKQLGCSTNARYKVVMIGRIRYNSNWIPYEESGSRSFIYDCKFNEFVAKVFCFESGQWSDFVISYSKDEFIATLPQRWLDVVASNGILYWLEGFPLKGIVAFDPFNDIYTGQCRLISLPIVCFKNTESSTKDKVSLGLVNGELRLSQLYKAHDRNRNFVLRVWELKNHDNESSSWALVYSLKLNRLENEMFVLSFHPNNANVIFLLCGDDVCKYDIFEKRYEKVGEYPSRNRPIWFNVSTFILLHPSWPTPISVLRSS